MIYLPPIPELSLLTVGSPGVPNEERIILLANAQVNLAQYAIILSFKPGNLSTPLNDHFFWLGDMQLSAGTYILVYTGSGQTRMTKIQDTNEPAFVMHWGKKNIIFGEENLVPNLIRLGGVENERYPTVVSSLRLSQT